MVVDGYEKSKYKNDKNYSDIYPNVYNTLYFVLDRAGCYLWQYFNKNLTKMWTFT